MEIMAQPGSWPAEYHWQETLQRRYFSRVPLIQYGRKLSLLIIFAQFLNSQTREVRSMSLRLLCSTMVLAAASTVAAQTAPNEQTEKAARVVNPPFSLSISTPHEIVKVGEPIQVDIMLRNTSPNKLHFFFRRGPVPDLDAGLWGIEVRDMQGSGVPRLPKRPAPALRGIEHDSGFSLEPGKTLRGRLNVNTFYDLGKSGTYTIQLERTDRDTKISGKSNTITVTVTK